MSRIKKKTVMKRIYSWGVILKEQSFIFDDDLIVDLPSQTSQWKRGRCEWTCLCNDLSASFNQ